MKTTLRHVLLPASLAAGVLPFTGGTAVAATWELVDNDQVVCLDIDNGRYPNTIAYYGIWIDGDWTRSLNATLRNVPIGSTTWGGGLPIPPDSSDGVYSLAYVAVEIPTDTELGTYTLDLSVGAGRQRQTVPVTLVVVADSCSDY